MTENNETIVFESFDDMSLKEEILRGIYAYGFEKPSVIQQQAIVPLASGRDLIAQAQSGTGKTGTFSIGLLQRIDPVQNATQAIILAHTRELARQILSVISSIAEYTDIRFELMIGGVGRGRNLGRFRSGKSEKQVPHVVVGTPGRICDNLVNRRMNSNEIKLIVLDEADEILSRGFQEQVDEIFQQMPKDVQIGLFSATIPADMLELTEKLMRDPIHILVKRDQLTLEGIRQFYVNVEREDYKFDTLCDLYNNISITQAIIFCNKKNKVEWLARCMREQNFTVEAMSSYLSQDERNAVMNDFRDGRVRVLITTDILARGIDVQQVSLVINYDLPLDRETYIHRVGRSGRFGRKGTAINFCTFDDENKIKDLEEFYSTQIGDLPMNIADIV